MNLWRPLSQDRSYSVVIGGCSKGNMWVKCKECDDLIYRSHSIEGN